MNQKKAYGTTVLAVINCIVFFYLSLFGNTEDPIYMLNRGAMYIPYVLEYGQYYRIFTSMFLHFGFNHLMSNMVGLIFLGGHLEQRIGTVKYLIIYLISGLCGTLISTWNNIQIGRFPVSAGASGAIFGLMGAFVYVSLRYRRENDRSLGLRLLVMVAINVYAGFSGVNIDNFAHIGGLVGGFICAAVLDVIRGGLSPRRSGDTGE